MSLYGPHDQLFDAVGEAVLSYGSLVLTHLVFAVLTHLKRLMPITVRTRGVRTLCKSHVTYMHAHILDKCRELWEA